MSDISEYRSKGNTPVIPATQETETGEFRASIVKKGPEFNLQYKMGKNIQEIFLANLLWWVVPVCVYVFMYVVGRGRYPLRVAYQIFTL